MRDRREELKGTPETFGLIDMFATLIVVMVSWIKHISKMIKSYTLNMAYSLFCVN